MKNLFFIFYLIPIIMVGQNKLLIPPTISGNQIDLELQNGSHEFYKGKQTATMGINGAILGPTIILKKGDEIEFNVINSLNQPTTIHWHGLHVSSTNDGGPHLIIPSKSTWSPRFEIKNRASTCWYHPHLDTYTDEHVSKGIAGFIIIQDEEESNFNLPRTYGVDDFPLAIQTKDFDANYQIKHHVNSDDVLMVNATIDPFVSVPAQVVRFRLLDGSSQRVFNFGLENNKKFHLIASDGGLLERPVTLTRLPMSPGERAEILIDFAGMEGQTIHLMSYASELASGIYGASLPGPNSRMILNGYNPNYMNGSDFNVISFVVGPKTKSSIDLVPKELKGEEIPSQNDVDEKRTLTFRAINGGMNQLNGDFYINGVSFDKDVINMTIDLDNTEIWTITNQTPIAHPFHLHDVGFHILDINGSPPPPHARGKKDTYLVPGRFGEMRFITKFKNFANDSIPYMFHCHMLKHEDGGMMGSFVVVDKLTSLDETETDESDILMFPNPSSGQYFTVKLIDPEENIIGYAIVNEQGQIVTYHKIHKNEISNQFSIPTDNYINGVYMVKIYSDRHIYNRNITIVK